MNEQSTPRPQTYWEAVQTDARGLSGGDIFPDAEDLFPEGHPDIRVPLGDTVVIMEVSTAETKDE